MHEHFEQGSAPFNSKFILMNNLLELELNAIIDTSTDNIVVADCAGVVLRVSRNCEAVYGEKSSYLLGKSVQKLEADGIFTPSVTNLVLKKKKAFQVMQKTPTGRVVMATGVPVFDESGKLLRVISYSHDLTEIQRLKEDYEELQNRMKIYSLEIQELREKDQIREDVVLKSNAIKVIWKLVERVAKTNATVLFLGESGVGKNVFARALQKMSERRTESYLEVNCCTIPDALFESEMFGYESGSFTGAGSKGKPGLIELSNNGTLFLDEVGELPLSVQSKLLKAIQDKSISRVGSIKSQQIDFRLIASTNKDISQMVKRGTFREDLFYRLNVIPITIPPLRDRKEDISTLAAYFLQKFNQEHGTNKFFNASTIYKLSEYLWPGNVRELQNVVERLVITTESRNIYPENLPYNIIQDTASQVANLNVDKIEEKVTSLKEELEKVEIKWLARAMKQNSSTYEMAEYLGVNQSTVVRKLKKYHLTSR